MGEKEGSQGRYEVDKNRLHRVRRVDVTMQLIRDALAMPEDTIIEGIERHPWIPNVFTFYVTHPSFEPISYGEEIPQLSPSLTADYDKRPATWIEFKWDYRAEE